MATTPLESRVVILVKALPQPSKTYGETVCCAGITATGQWKRLFPVRFRHLSGSNSFNRWDWVTYRYRPPTVDGRSESCHVYEDTIKGDGQLRLAERPRLLAPIIRASAEEAMKRGESLALVRPVESRFYYRPKKPGEIEAEREAFKRAARQIAMFDSALSEIEPSPYHFRFRFRDPAGTHDHTCGDWETHAMFYNLRQRFNESEALSRMSTVFNDEYPAKGMVFALGNQAKRPRTWQMLRVIRLDDAPQGELSFR